MSVATHELGAARDPHSQDLLFSKINLHVLCFLPKAMRLKFRAAPRAHPTFVAAVESECSDGHIPPSVQKKYYFPWKIQDRNSYMD